MLVHFVSMSFGTHISCDILAFVMRIIMRRMQWSLDEDTDQRVSTSEAKLKNKS